MISATESFLPLSRSTLWSDSVDALCPTEFSATAKDAPSASANPGTVARRVALVVANEEAFSNSATESFLTSSRSRLWLDSGDVSCPTEFSATAKDMMSASSASPTAARRVSLIVIEEEAFSISATEPFLPTSRRRL